MFALFCLLVLGMSMKSLKNHKSSEDCWGETALWICDEAGDCACEVNGEHWCVDFAATSKEEMFVECPEGEIEEIDAATEQVIEAFQ